MERQRNPGRGCAHFPGFYDRQPWGDDNRGLYFTDKGWAGGKVFAYRQGAVRQYLIDNALFWLDEYRIDGIRYVHLTVRASRNTM